MIEAILLKSNASIAKRMMKRISEVSILISAVIYLASLPLFSGPGDRVILFVIMGGFAIPPLILGPKIYRILGACALVLSISSAYFDHDAGRRLNERIERIRSDAEQRPGEPE